MAVVEVRQPTLGGAGRGWGPAANTGLGWPWLRSGSQHLARMAVVEVRRQEEARRRRRRRRRRKEEAAALIKSNNPHLAGGEKNGYPKNFGVLYCEGGLLLHFGKMAYFILYGFINAI